MKVKAFKGLLKFGIVFLCLTLFTSICMLYYIDFVEMRTWFKVEFQKKVNFSIIIPTVSSEPHRNHSFCSFRPLSPEEALEEKLLLDSIAWPQAPPLTSPLHLNETSDPAHSTFTILPRRGGGQWHTGDQLEVLITMFDFLGRPKKSGGDFFIARLHSMTLGAGVAGQVVDHLNGSYSAVFSLLWEGGAQVEVDMIHPSEAVPLLYRLNSEEPDRVGMSSRFNAGSASESTVCNICLRPTQQPLCNFTDLHTGEPWFCYKPKNLSCDARINHYRTGFKKILQVQENELFQSGVNLKASIPASGPANVTVFPRTEGEAEVKSSNVKSRPSGYYYRGVWHSLGGTTVHQFNSSAISQCLKGKQVHMYGDSTIRQWFDFFTSAQPELKEFTPRHIRPTGPRLALDYGNHILMTYRCHGPPIRFTPIPLTELRYIANEVDGINGGSDTVVVVGVWAHFTSFPIEVYIRRLMSIRKAVLRLLARAPDTVVIIRTPNLREIPHYEWQIVSDWYSLQRDKALRAVFRGVNVHLVDAWEMTLAHHLPHNVHPPQPIIKNMMNVVLSYICPASGS